MISVLAYNIHFGKKLDLIQKWILKRPNKFDIVCLQEFPFEENSEFLEKMKKHSYDFKFAPSFKRGRQYGELTLFKKDKIKLINHKVAKLGTNLIENRFRRKNGEKSSLLTLFQYENKKFMIANSHLLCIALNSRRIDQLSKILRTIKTITSDKTVPTIILGDFNYTSRIRQKKLIEFMASHKFYNAYKTHTHKLFFLKQQLDYVFYRNCNVKDPVIDNLKLSDHYSVQFKLDFSVKTEDKQKENSKIESLSFFNPSRWLRL